MAFGTEHVDPANPVEPVELQ